MPEKSVMVIKQSTLFVLKDIGLVKYGQEQAAGERDDDVYIQVAEGWGELMAGDRRLPLSFGKTVRIASGCAAVVSGVPDHFPLQVYRIVVEKLELMEQSAAHRMFRRTGYVGADVAELELPAASSHRSLQLLHKLEKLWTDRQQGRDSDIQQLFHELLSEWSASRTEPSVGDDRDKLALTVSYIEQHFTSRISRGEAAKRAGMNADYFSVWFKKSTGCGFSEYVNRLRMDRAKQLLLTPGCTVQEAADRAGYEDAFYFSRKFKQWTGESPSAYAARPKRIVALQHTGHLLALGIQPVGAAETYLSRWGIAERELAETTIISEHVHEREIVSLRPDLIVGHQYLGGELEKKLRCIATTIIVDYNQQSPFELFYRLADLLGKNGEAEWFRSRYAEEAETIRRKLQGIVRPEETVAYYEFRPPYVWLMCEANGRGVYNLYHALGFRAPPALQRDVLDKEKPLKIRLEQLADYAADHMLVGVYDSTGKEAYDLQQLRQHPIWGKLPAASSNRLHIVDLTAFSASDVLSLYYQLSLQGQYLMGRI